MIIVDEEKIKSDLSTIEKDTIENVCNLLRQQNKATYMYLADYVASVCDVDKDEMLSDTKHLCNSHARWLYWYAYRYMTKESYDAIAKKGESYRRFTESCVGICVAKMSMMIEQEAIWKKRWAIIKRVVKVILGNMCEEPYDEQILTLKVIAPKGVKVETQTINKQ